MFSCTSTHTSCYAAARSLALPHIRHATLHDLHLYFMLRYMIFTCITWGWGGVGWDVNVHCDCNHIVRSLMFSCTSTHTSCYAAARSLALPHIRHATLHDLHLYFMLRYMIFTCITWGWGGVGWDVNVHCDCNHIVRSLMFSCTSTHTSCYAAARSLALPHIRHATLHDLHLYFMLRYMIFTCITWGWGGVGWGGMLTFIATATT